MCPVCPHKSTSPVHLKRWPLRAPGCPHTSFGLHVVQCHLAVFRGSPAGISSSSVTHGRDSTTVVPGRPKRSVTETCGVSYATISAVKPVCWCQLSPHPPIQQQSVALLACSCTLPSSLTVPSSGPTQRQLMPVTPSLGRSWQSAR